MDFKSTQKAGPTTKFNISSIGNVLNLVLAAFSIPQTPAASIPPQLIFIGGKLRPGLSSKQIASRIISRQTEAGLISGDVFNDGPNKSEAMEVIRVEEIINSLTTEAKIDVVIDPGIQITAVGVGNLGIPIISQGATTNIGQGTAVIS